MSMALFSPPPPPPPSLSTLLSSSKPKLSYKPHLTLLPFKKPLSLFLTKSAADNGAGASSSSSSTSAAAAVVEEKLEKKAEQVAPSVEKEEEVAVELNGAALKTKVAAFKDPRWVKGTWDLKQFGEGGKTNWDAVIDAEARRRKWLEDNPEASSNDEPILFDTSVIPWWSWIKRYHLPEAELLNGRAAMVGFFMAYFVDSLTGVGLVDQMGNFFCKTLLFVAVVGVLLIRKNEDIETVKKLFEETTFYDKQWQATWQEDSSNDSKSK